MLENFVDDSHKLKKNCCKNKKLQIQTKCVKKNKNFFTKSI